MAANEAFEIIEGQMDVSGWTPAQRLKFPDWCFPERQVIGVYTSNPNVGTWVFEISEIVLPTDCVLWEVGWLLMMEDPGSNIFRMGLRATVPVNDGEMDSCLEVLPYFGQLTTGPNRITCGPATNVAVIVPVRKILVTSGYKLVCANYCGVGKGRLLGWVLVSGLPTNVPRWLSEDNI